jgi:hypothetical protein
MCLPEISGHSGRDFRRRQKVWLEQTHFSGRLALRAMIKIIVLWGEGIY